MHEMVRMVAEFHQKHKAAVGEEKTVSHLLLRQSLILEELAETQLALWRGDWPRFFDGIGDLAYVAVGDLVSFGFPPVKLPSCLQVYRSVPILKINMVALSRAICAYRSVELYPVQAQNTVVEIHRFASRHGLPLGEIFKRVHDSNMTKMVSGDTRVSNKGPDFRPPVFDDLVAEWLEHA